MDFQKFGLKNIYIFEFELNRTNFCKVKFLVENWDFSIFYHKSIVQTVTTFLIVPILKAPYGVDFFCSPIVRVRFIIRVMFMFLLQVSWIRHRDIHLLTVGRYTYTSDQRFSAHHVPMTHFWQLRIRGLTHRDSGKYECQVSTTPPRGHQMYLSVVGKAFRTFHCEWSTYYHLGTL